MHKLNTEFNELKKSRTGKIFLQNIVVCESTEKRRISSILSFRSKIFRLVRNVPCSATFDWIPKSAMNDISLRYEVLSKARQRLTSRSKCMRSPSAHLDVFSSRSFFCRSSWPNSMWITRMASLSHWISPYSSAINVDYPSKSNVFKEIYAWNFAANHSVTGYSSSKMSQRLISKWNPTLRQEKVHNSRKSSRNSCVGPSSESKRGPATKSVTNPSFPPQSYRYLPKSCRPLTRIFFPANLRFSSNIAIVYRFHWLFSISRRSLHCRSSWPLISMKRLVMIIYISIVINGHARKSNCKEISTRWMSRK